MNFLINPVLLSKIIFDTTIAPSPENNSNVQFLNRLMIRSPAKWDAANLFPHMVDRNNLAVMISASTNLCENPSFRKVMLDAISLNIESSFYKARDLFTGFLELKATNPVAALRLLISLMNLFPPAISVFALIVEKVADLSAQAPSPWDNLGWMNNPRSFTPSAQWGYPIPFGYQPPPMPFSSENNGWQGPLHSRMPTPESFNASLVGQQYRSEQQQRGNGVDRDTALLQLDQLQKTAESFANQSKWVLDEAERLRNMIVVNQWNQPTPASKAPAASPESAAPSMAKPKRVLKPTTKKKPPVTNA